MVTRLAAIGPLLLVAAFPAQAEPHLGWCLGVGNPHQSAYCGSGTRPPQSNPVTLGPGLQTPPGGTGPGSNPRPPSTQLPQQPQQPVPQTIALPVLPVAQGTSGPLTPSTVTLQAIPGPGTTSVTQGGGPVQLPPIVVTLPPQPRPISAAIITPPAATMDVPPLSYVSHQIVVGPIAVPQVVVNAGGPGAQAVPGQIILTPIAIPVPQPPAGTVPPPKPAALQPPLPGVALIPQATPNPQTVGALLVPVLMPPLPGTPDPVPQGVPDPQRPGQVLVPVLIPGRPVPEGKPPQGVPGAQLPDQILVPVLVPSLPARPPRPDIPQGVPNPQRPTALQPPPLRPPIIVTPKPPQVIAAVVFPRPKPRPVLVPPTTLLQPSLSHRPAVARPPVGTAQITQQPGRQPSGDQPVFTDPFGGGHWTCAASGLGTRQVLKGGRVITTGVERHVGNVDALGRDVPAKHPKHPHCIIAVQRRDGG